MYIPDNHKFKDEQTRRFHDYFYPKLKSKELDADVFYDDFKVAEISKYSFFSGMRSGAKGVTIEQLAIAWEKYHVRPDYLFGIVAEPTSVVSEPDQVYRKSLQREVAKMRRALDELEKKIENSKP